MVVRLLIFKHVKTYAKLGAGLAEICADCSIHLDCSIRVSQSFVKFPLPEN